MIRRQKKSKKGRSKLGTALKIGAGVAVAGGALLAGRAIAKRVSSGGGKKRRKRSAMWFAKEITRIKLKKRYDKLRIGA